MSSSGLPLGLTGSTLLELVSTGSVPALEVGSVGSVTPAEDVGSVGFVAPALEVGFVGSVGFVAPAEDVGFVGSVVTDEELNFSMTPVCGSTVAFAEHIVRSAKLTFCARGAPFKSITIPASK